MSIVVLFIIHILDRILMLTQTDFYIYLLSLYSKASKTFREAANLRLK